MEIAAHSLPRPASQICGRSQLQWPPCCLAVTRSIVCPGSDLSTANLFNLSQFLFLFVLLASFNSIVYIPALMTERALFVRQVRTLRRYCMAVKEVGRSRPQPGAPSLLGPLPVSSIFACKMCVRPCPVP